MPGFFSDTSGLDATRDFGSTNNAAADFERSGAPPSDLFDRLFGGRKRPIQSQELPPPPAPPQGPQPAISSAPSLVSRVLKSSLPAPPAMPPGPRAQPPFDPSMLRQPPVDQPQPLPPLQYPGAGAARAPISMRDIASQPFNYPGAGAARAPVPPPAAEGDSLSQIISALTSLFSGGNEFGGNRFGGNEFGGNRFGGQRFGGQRFGASAPRPVDSLPLPPRTEAPGGYFARGGYARGGIPELMLGMPQRRAEGSYVEPDGQGDGRSDHIPAVLSPGEYVMDAELVSLLGNGDNDAGARALDQFREDVRKQKGGRLARGEISDDARPAISYLKKGR